MKCVLTFDKAANTLTTTNLMDKSSTKTIPTTLLTNIVLLSANYSVSDDCLGVRVNDKIFHWSGSAYALDSITHPTTNITTIPNPVFSSDFNVMVTDFGVYYYTSSSTSYTSDKAESFGRSKEVFKNDNNLLIINRG